MAGLEKQNLHIQIVRAIGLIILSLWLIPIIGLLSVVALYVAFMLFVNATQLVFISKYVKISPFSKNLLFLFLLTIIGMYFAIIQEYSFEIYHYFAVPIMVYVLYFAFMYNPLKRLIKELSL